ncbi:MAG: type II toxin-antitoxin system VapB family antitoxin [Gemmatimonadota bacterium]
MRITLNIDEDLLRKAQRLSGLEQKTAVLHAVTPFRAPGTAAAGCGALWHSGPRARARS